MSTRLTSATPEARMVAGKTADAEKRELSPRSKNATGHRLLSVHPENGQEVDPWDTPIPSQEP